MSYTIKGVKTFRGMEGQGFNATLCRDGKPVAHVDDEGCGGCYNWRWLVKDAELAGDGPGEHEVLTSETALQRAEALSRGGNYRNAVRYLYLSALLLLDERGLLRYDRSRTNREYLRTVSDSPALIQPLRTVIEIFDRVWYGFEPIDAQTYQEYVERVGELRKQKP